MSYFFRYLFLALWSCLAPAWAYAQATTTTETPDLALRVEAPRTRALPSEDSTAQQSRLDTAALTRPGATPTETLEYIPGVHGLETGPGAGAYGTFFIRGATAAQSQVYLGDIPLGRSGRPFDPQTLPFSLVDHISVYRSVTPLGLGSNTMGGTIVLHPLQLQRRQLRAGAGLGSFRSAEFSASYAEAGSTATHFVAARIQGTQGDFTYADDRGTAFNTSDDLSSQRRNNWQESLSAIDSLSWNPGSHHQVALLNYVHINRGGLPGSGVAQARAAERAALQQILGLSYRTSIAGADLHARLYEEFLRDQQEDPLAEFGHWPNDSDHRTAVFGAAADAVIPTVAWLDLALAALYEREKYTPSDRLALSNPPASLRHTSTLGLQTPIYLMQHRIQLVPTLQWQYSLSRIAQQDAAHSNKGVAETIHQLPLARLGILYRITPHLDVLSNLARGTRLPGFVELFGDGGQLIPNTALRPESSLTADLGLRGRIGTLHHRARMELAGFWTRQHDTIHYSRATRDTWIAQNMDGATLRGLEFGASSDHWSHARMQLAFTLIDARLLSPKPYYDDKQLPLRPPLTAVAQTTVYHQFHRIGTFEVSPAINYQSANYLDPANRVIVPSRAVWSAELGWLEPHDRITVRAAVRNLANRSFFDYAYYPLPGRNFYLTVDARLI